MLEFLFQKFTLYFHTTYQHSAYRLAPLVRICC